MRTVCTVAFAPGTNYMSPVEHLTVVSVGNEDSYSGRKHFFSCSRCGAQGKHRSGFGTAINDAREHACKEPRP